MTDKGTTTHRKREMADLQWKGRVGWGSQRGSLFQNEGVNHRMDHPYLGGRLREERGVWRGYREEELNRGVKRDTEQVSRSAGMSLSNTIMVI